MLRKKEHPDEIEAAYVWFIASEVSDFLATAMKRPAGRHGQPIAAHARRLRRRPFGKTPIGSFGKVDVLILRLLASLTAKGREFSDPPRQASDAAKLHIVSLSLHTRRIRRSSQPN